MSAPPQPSNVEEEAKLVFPLLRLPLRVGEAQYVISRKWFEQWCRYVGLDADAVVEGKEDAKAEAADGDRPGPIDNRELHLAGSKYPELRMDVTEHIDFEIIPAAAYDLLAAWYGTAESSPTFARSVIAVGLQQLERVDLFPVFLSVVPADPVTGEPDYSRQHVVPTSTHVLLYSLVDLFFSGVDETKRPEARIWLRGKEVKSEGGESAAWRLLDSLESKQKVESFEFSQGAEVMIEFKNAEGVFVRKEPPKKDWTDFSIGDVVDAKDYQGKWYMAEVKYIAPDGRIEIHFIGWSARYDEWIEKADILTRLAPKNTHTTAPYKSKEAAYHDTYYRDSSTSGVPVERGAVGLRNLGNTCFMNSTLQCLSNTPGLTDYFMDNKHLREINRDNPLGCGGKVAESYGDLLHEMWGGKLTVVAPRKFKQVIGEYQPRFSGYAQQDSSELLSFLLDGLHEDLNRVRKKPPTQPVESNGRPDELVAVEAWERHKLRNQSVIVDMCQGQLKSVVDCPDCKRQSVTFDPYMFLSVPLPQEEDRIFEVTLVRSKSPAGEQKPTVYAVKLPKTATARDLKDALAEAAGVKPTSFIICEIWNNKLYRVLSNDVALSRMGPKDDVWAYSVDELNHNFEPVVEGVKKETWISLQVFQQATDRKAKKRIARSMGVPFVIAIPESKIKVMPIAELREILRDGVAPFVRGGWQPEDRDADLYQIAIYDKPGHEFQFEVPMKDEGTVDLTDKTGVRGFSLSLVWDEEKLADRFWDGKPARDPASSDTRLKAGIDVYDCMDAFTAKEVLRESEAWYCSECKKHQCATKKFDLWTLPDVLIIHLKRFNYNRLFRDKIDTFVDFPIDGLDLSKWVVNPEEKKNVVYDLYAVSNHYGGLGGGHYTAYAKNLINKRWYCLDDSSVSDISADRARTSAAYVLFYHRRTPKGTGTSMRPLAPTKGLTPGTRLA